MSTTLQSPPKTALLSESELLKHWQGHRRLTRRVIEAFPEKDLLEFKIGGMRSFFELAMEVATLAAPAIQGVATGIWPSIDHVGGENPPKSKTELLQFWDNVTIEMDQLWPTISPENFHKQDKAFGQYDGKNIDTILYLVDNEIHHRGQGYVYLRALGITPPAFWER